MQDPTPQVSAIILGIVTLGGISFCGVSVCFGPLWPTTKLISCKKQTWPSFLKLRKKSAHPKAVQKAS
eukprot:2227052-Amphidinium_carterae.1